LSSVIASLGRKESASIPETFEIDFRDPNNNMAANYSNGLLSVSGKPSEEEESPDIVAAHDA